MRRGKIAHETGQWKLTDAKSRKDGKAKFDDVEFSSHLKVQQSFQMTFLKALRTSGQTAFYISYEDLQSVEIMNGLDRYWVLIVNLRV